MGYRIHAKSVLPPFDMAIAFRILGSAHQPTNLCSRRCLWNYWKCFGSLSLSSGSTPCGPACETKLSALSQTAAISLKVLYHNMLQYGIIKTLQYTILLNGGPSAALCSVKTGRPTRGLGGAAAAFYRRSVTERRLSSSEIGNWQLP